MKGWLIIVALAVLLMAGSLVRLVVAHGVEVDVPSAGLWQLPTNSYGKDQLATVG